MARPSFLTETLGAARRQLRLLFVISFLSNLLLLVSSIYMMQVFDRVLSSGSLDTLMWLSIIAIVAIAAWAFLEQARRVILTRVGSWLASELSPEVIRRSIAQRLRSGHSSASLADVGDLRSFAGGDAILAFLDAPWSPVFIAVIWLMHPLLGVVALGGAVLLFAIAFVHDLANREGQTASTGRMREVRGAAEAYLARPETMAGLGMIGPATANWQAANRAAENDGAETARRSTVYLNLSRGLRMALQIAIMAAGAALVLRAELTSGGMIAASIILSRALSPVERAISAWKSYVSYRRALSRLTALFAQTAATGERLRLPRPAGLLDLKEVRAFAPGQREPILKSVSFTLQPGESCGLLGTSGSGKSTLCKLIVGAWQPAFGEIRLDGANIADWDSDLRGPFVGYLPQSVELFPGTVAQNIARLGAVDDDAVLKAARLAGAHEMILALPEGYETQVGDHSQLLSGGQKQRIGLARALYGDPSLVILDEPNSNLDGAGEIALQQAIEALAEAHRTVIVVSHLPNILRRMDKVLVIGNGTVARFGPRDQILREMVQAGRGETPGGLKAVAE